LRENIISPRSRARDVARRGFFCVSMCAVVRGFSRQAVSLPRAKKFQKQAFGWKISDP
jgi:hypothetical protein